MPELVVVTLPGNFVGAADGPGVFRRAVVAELYEQFLEARVELTLAAVALKAQRHIAGSRHTLVYVGSRARREWPKAPESGRQKRKKGAPFLAPPWKKPVHS